MPWKDGGQNGFRFSLRGFAPEWDYEWLTSEVRARAIDYAFPDESLLVQKPLGRAPHQGGVRFDEIRLSQDAVGLDRRTRTYKTTNELDALRLEILPGKQGHAAK